MPETGTAPKDWTKRAAILEELQLVAENKCVPRGTFTAVANKYSVSRVYVGVLAARNGFKSVSKRDVQKLVKDTH